MSSPVYVFGLDGGTFELLIPWMEQGLLPNLQALMDGGVHGELTSTVPPVTAVAWSSFMTGKNPGRHGVFDFMVSVPGSYEYQPVNAPQRRGRALWDLISAAGGRVVVLNVPTTYPPHPVNGVCMSSFLTPSGKRDFLYPPELLAEMEERFGPYPLSLQSMFSPLSLNDANIDRFLQECKAKLAHKFRVARWLLQREAPDFFMIHLFAGDQISHWLWHVLDPDHPRYAPALARKHGAKIVEYWQRFDLELGRLREAMPANATVLVMSDHGFGPWNDTISLNTWLWQEGYLAIKDNLVSRLRLALFRLGLTPEVAFAVRPLRAIVSAVLSRLVRQSGGVAGLQHEIVKQRRRLLLSINDVDWSRTRAYAFYGYGQITLNVKGRQPQGVIAPGAEYEAVLEEIADKLRQLRDPRTGQPVGGEVYTRQEIYEGPWSEHAPDLFYLPMANKYMPRSLGFTSHRVISNGWGITGLHKMNGIFIGHGPALRRRATIQGAHIVDLAPTILHLLDLPVPTDMDGRVLAGAFDPAYLAAHPVRYQEEREDRARGAQELTPEEEAEIVSRLTALGYLD